MNDFIPRLEAALRQPLPGRDAQYKMAHVARQVAAQPPSDAREAGVMALFFPKDAAWHLVLIQRKNDNPNDRHGGQISFPGGKRDAADIDMAHTALRETEEEVGVPAHEIQLLGELTELYIPVSNFLVKPYVGYVPYQPTFAPQWQEVEQVLEVGWAELRHTDNRVTTDLRLHEQLTIPGVPCFRIGGHIIWGATAMMLSELLDVAEPKV